MRNAQATVLDGSDSLKGPQARDWLGECPARGRAAGMALLRYLRPRSVDVPCLPARRAAVEPREPVRGQGRRASGGRCPVADPHAKLRAPRGDIFPAGPPAPASAPGRRGRLWTGGGSRAPPWGAPLLAGGGVTSHPGRRGHRRCGNLSVAEERGASRATYPGASGPRWARRLPPPPGRRGDLSCAWYLWTPVSSAWSPPPHLPGAETRTEMLLPYPAPSERRGVGEAGPGRCTEKPPELRAAGAPGLPGDGGQAGLGPLAGARGGWQTGRRPVPAPPSPGQARAGRPGRAGRAQRPDPGRPRFEAGNGCPRPGRPALRLCD